MSDWKAWRDYWYSAIKNWKPSKETEERIDREYDQLFGSREDAGRSTGDQTKTVGLSEPKEEAERLL